MSKRALLVGCNYPGSSSALNGCVNDVASIKAMLIEYYGFSESDIVTLIDTDPASVQPTGKNIKDNLTKLVAASATGDVLVFHFSGHGTQISDGSSEESDGKDEAICPTDMNLICDDDLRAIFMPLADGVHFTMISDCCHSGSMLDHPEQQISGNKDGSAPAGPSGAAALFSMFGTKDISPDSIQAALAAQLKPVNQEEVQNRGIPQSKFMELFNMMNGGGSGGSQPMQANNVRAALGAKFGPDASLKVAGAAKMLDDFLSKNAAKYTGGNAQAAQGVNMLRKLLSCVIAPAAGSTAPTSAPATSAPAGSYPPPVLAGHKPPVGQQLAADKGVLITGCQSMETSADACPSGDKNQAFGALTNALTASVKAMKATDKATPITYRQLVSDVRETLLKTGFTQNPCLECSDANVDTVFIC